MRYSHDIEFDRDIGLGTLDPRKIVMFTDALSQPTKLRECLTSASRIGALSAGSADREGIVDGTSQPSAEGGDYCVAFLLKIAAWTFFYRKLQVLFVSVSFFFCKSTKFGRHQSTSSLTNTPLVSAFHAPAPLHPQNDGHLSDESGAGAKDQIGSQRQRGWPRDWLPAWSPRPLERVGGDGATKL